MATDWTAEDADDTPYKMTGGVQRNCPECLRPLEPKAVLCVACGYHLQRRKKVTRTFKPLERHWESGPTLAVRWRSYLICVGIASVLGLPVALLDGELWSYLLGSWLMLVVLLAFILGTFDEMDLQRNEKGKITLTKTWRVCFVKQRPEKLPLGQFQGVVTGRLYEPGFWTWCLFVLMLLWGILPGLIWWYVAIHKEVVYVALGKTRGGVDRYIYRGWDEEKMVEIAQLVKDVAELP
jgi:hypothetical protein